MKPDEFKAIEAKGWKINPDGTYSKRPRDFRAVEAGCSERSASCALDSSPSEQQGCKESVGLGPSTAQRKASGHPIARVAMIAMRRRLLDPDAIAFACKPLTDAVADSLGVDDADPRVHWEWSQVRTDGKEGVVVIVEDL